MKTWYKAACYTCGEAIDLFVSNPSCTAHYLGEYDKEIQEWLSKHVFCDLRLMNEHQSDAFFDSGFEPIRGEGLRMYIKTR